MPGPGEERHESEMVTVHIDDSSNTTAAPAAEQKQQASKPRASFAKEVEEKDKRALEEALFNTKPPQPDGIAGGLVKSAELGQGLLRMDRGWEETFRHPSTNKYAPVSMYKTPKNTLITIIRAGMAKAVLPWWHIFILGFMAGAYISFGGILGLQLAGNVDVLKSPDLAGIAASLQKVLFACSFPFCLMMIVMSGGELFTGNTMYMTAALLTKKVNVKALLKSWSMSWLGNFAGCCAFAFFFVSVHTTQLNGIPHDGQTPPPIQRYVYKMLESKTTTGWGAAFLKAVACNWLVTMSLWWAACAEDVTGKVIAIWWPIMGFVATGFEHSIANMFYLMLGLMDFGPSTFGRVLAWNLIPVTLGNILGGCMFISVQVLIFGPYFAPHTLGVQAGEKKPGLALMGPGDSQRMQKLSTPGSAAGVAMEMHRSRSMEKATLGH